MKKKEILSNPITSFFINHFFDIIKDAFSNMGKRKNTDLEEHLSTIEHLNVKLEKQIQENRHMIKTLLDRVFWSSLTIICLLGAIFLQLVLS